MPIIERQLLRDILAMRDWLASLPRETLSDELAHFQLLPEAILNWLADQFNLAPHLNRGQELEVPASKVSTFDCEQVPEAGSKDLVRIVVLEPGWKRGSTMIRPARVRVLTPAGSC